METHKPEPEQILHDESAWCEVNDRGGPLAPLCERYYEMTEAVFRSSSPIFLLALYTLSGSRAPFAEKSRV